MNLRVEDYEAFFRHIFDPAVKKGANRVARSQTPVWERVCSRPRLALPPELFEGWVKRIGEKMNVPFVSLC
jgi:hypothetical protein